MDEAQGMRQRDTSKEELPLSPISDDILKLILDRQRVSLDMINMIKGVSFIVRKDDETGKVYGEYVKTGDPIMNEKGINFFSTFFYSAMSVDKLTTNISEEEMSIMMKEMSFAITDVIAERGEEFGIDASSRSFLLLQIEHFYHMALSGSRRGTIINLLKPIMRREETYTPQQQQKKSIWSLPTFLKGGT